MLHDDLTMSDSSAPALAGSLSSSLGFRQRITSSAKLLRAAARVLLSGESEDTRLFVRSEPQPVPMPQAITEDSSPQRIEARDWRQHFSHQLHGLGLEIGPLHRPLVTHAGMKVEYIDRYTVAQLRAHYPELEHLPLVEPHIIGDGETLSNVPDQKYDFLVSAHVIEHMKNPIGSFEQWCRVIKPGGKLYLIVPDKRVIFDKQRVRTTLEHLILDYKRPSAERDFEHCLEYGLHVHHKTGLDAVAEADNIINTNYSIHYHTFIPVDIVNLIHWISANIRPLRIVEGPVMAPGSDEFHFLIEILP